jgi:hypothetical protein
MKSRPESISASQTFHLLQGYSKKTCRLKDSFRMELSTMLNI